MRQYPFRSVVNAIHPPSKEKEYRSLAVIGIAQQLVQLSNMFTPARNKELAEYRRLNQLFRLG